MKIRYISSRMWANEEYEFETVEEQVKFLTLISQLTIYETELVYRPGVLTLAGQIDELMEEDLINKLSSLYETAILEDVPY